MYEVPAEDQIQATNRMLEAFLLGVECEYHAKDIIRAQEGKPRSGVTVSLVPPRGWLSILRDQLVGAGAHNRLYYAGKHKHHGVNLQGMTDPQGRLIWISDGLPGSTHDLTAARAHGVFDVADRAELYLYADNGYVGGYGLTLLTPYKGRNLPDSAREANRCHAAIRANAERGFAVLKSWKIFDRFRSCPR